MAKILNLVFAICFLVINTDGLKVNPNKSNFPKMKYTKIHSISYRKPIYLAKKKPYTFKIVSLINKTVSNVINNYIDEVYAMAYLPLSFIILDNFNKSDDNIDI